MSTSADPSLSSTKDVKSHEPGTNLAAVVSGVRIRRSRDGGIPQPAHGSGSLVGDDPVAAIRAVLDRQEADWNRGDLEAFLTGYWKSPRVVFQSGSDRHDGWEAMAQRYRQRYKAEGKAMGRLSFSKLEIESLAPKPPSSAAGGG